MLASSQPHMYEKGRESGDNGGCAFFSFFRSWSDWLRTGNGEKGVFFFFFFFFFFFLAKLAIYKVLPGFKHR